MSLSVTVVNGKLPHFDGTYKQGEGEGKSFLSWAVSVPRDYKKPDEKYYPEDLINFKAFGPKADFINKYFNQGDGIVLQGRLQKDDDYEKDGQTVKGQLYLLVESAMFQAGKSGSAESNDSTPAPSGGSKAPTPPKPPIKKGNRPF